MLLHRLNQKVLWSLYLLLWKSNHSFWFISQAYDLFPRQYSHIWYIHFYFSSKVLFSPPKALQWVQWLILISQTIPQMQDKLEGSFGVRTFKQRLEGGAPEMRWADATPWGERWTRVLLVAFFHVVFYHEATTLTQLLSDRETRRLSCKTIELKQKERDLSKMSSHINLFPH